MSSKGSRWKKMMMRWLALLLAWVPCIPQLSTTVQTRAYLVKWWFLIGCRCDCESDGCLSLCGSPETERGDCSGGNLTPNPQQPSVGWAKEDEWIDKQIKHKVLVSLWIIMRLIPQQHTCMLAVTEGSNRAFELLHHHHCRKGICNQKLALRSKKKCIKCTFSSYLNYIHV